MDWSNEEYVRLYTRETAADLELSWGALALWRALLVKFDRAGLIPIKNGWVSVARLTRIPEDIVIQVGPELVRDGRIKMIDGSVYAPNFIAAQTASKSDKLRQRESRERRASVAHSAPQVIDSTNACHTPSHDVTNGHTPSRNVTLASAEPLPNLASAEPLLIPPLPAAQIEVLELEPATSKGKQNAPRRRLPDDWVPERSEANIAAEAAARERGVNLRDELSKLRDWAAANNNKKADWNATWRNWTRNAKPSSSGPTGLTAAQVAYQIAMGEKS